MPGIANIGTNAKDLRKAVLLQPYSKVIINVDDETGFVAGNDTGLTLELDCPWGTQQMANNILESVRGYQYQPYEVTTAIVDPAVELGDAVATNGVYGGIYQQDIQFGHTYYSDFSAPQDEQLDNEYQYSSPIERKIVRQHAWAKSEFKVLTDEIGAKVSDEGGNKTSFGWTLKSTAFTLYSGNKPVFTCDSDGVEIDGKITARSGFIGNGSSGFEIGNTFIRNGMTAFNDTTNNGIYLGTNGIALGKGNFSVSSSGELIAKTGRFEGTIYAKSLSFTNPDGTVSTINGSYLANGTVSDGKISGLSGSKVGSGINGGNINSGSVGSGQIGDSAVTNAKISSGAVSRGKTTSNVQSSLDNGDTAKASYDSLVAGSVTASYLRANSLYGGNLFVKYNSFIWYSVSWKQITVNGTTYTVLAH